MKSVSEWVATACGLGHIPFAPGTFGSLPGLALGVFTHSVLVDHWQCSAVNFILASTAIGCLICVLAHLSTVKMECRWKHDDSRIVIDEVAGQYFVSVYFPVTVFFVCMSFLFFRLFDILKPWPISWMDKQNYALATLLDDLMASIPAFISVAVLAKIFGLQIF